MHYHLDSTLVLALVALVLSGLSPIGFLVFQRRAKTVDDRAQRKQEDARRVNVAADALRRAKDHLITSAMEYELECVQLAIRASEEAVLLKEQGHVVEVEIVERREHSA